MPRILLSACLVLLLSAISAAGEENVLTNSSFAERNADGSPAGWRGSGDPIEVITAELPTGSAGAVSIRINTQAAGLGEFLQRVPAKESWIYRVSGYLRSDHPGLGLIQVKLYQQGREVKRFDVGAKSTPQWQEVSTEFVTPRGVDAVEVLCRYDRGQASQGKVVQFAAVSLTPLRERVYVPPQPTQLNAVATFQSIGVTLAYGGDASDAARASVRYRRTDDPQWRQAMDLVHRPTEQVFRGSILNVEPDTEYEIECTLHDSGYENHTPQPLATTIRTWTEDVPIARVVHLPAGVSNQPLVIRDRGTPDGWILYTSAEGGSTIDVGTAAQAAVTIDNAAYVILENITIRGGTVRGIGIENSTHVRIRRCDIAGWGEVGTRQEGVANGRWANAEGKPIDWQAGVHVGPGSSQVVVEGNFIHAPRGTTNSWANGHPTGKQGVILAMTNGNNVVRDNDIIGSEEHWWNDGIESLFNERIAGGPHRDTDISGNVIAFANDDGTELDGGQINVRFFNNWVQWAFCGISCAPNMAGPSYVYRNLFVVTGDQRGLVNFGFKMPGDRHPNPGRTFLLHNTMISSNSGLSTGHMGPGASPITARNNVYLSGELLLQGKIAGNYDMDYDLIQPGTLSPPDAPGQEAHAVIGVPKFVSAAAGDYRLTADSLGVDAAVRLAGVNDDHVGGAPDMGAFEQGAAALFPVRKSGMSALPLMNHIELRPGADSATAAIQLIVPPELGSRWSAHPNADWLRCEPATGTSGSGAQVVTISAGRSDLEPRVYRGAVTFRTEAGYCRTVLVQMRVRHAQPWAVQFEAESGELAGGFVRVEDPSASGGAYLQTPAGFDRFKENGRVSFAFDVPEDGVYYVQARIRVPGYPAMNHDSLQVAMDDGEPAAWHLQHLGSPWFHWLNVYDIKSEAPAIAYRLTRGRHVLHILPRETLASVDAVRISNEPFAPADGE